MGCWISIEYLDGRSQQFYCDECMEGEQFLTYYVYFGEKKGSYSIPFSSIKKYAIQRGILEESYNFFVKQLEIEKSN